MERKMERRNDLRVEEKEEEQRRTISFFLSIDSFFAFACSLKRERAVFCLRFGEIYDENSKKKYLAWVLLIDVDMLDR